VAELTTNQKIAGATSILITASILGHILSFGKEILVANYFGITKVMDAFYAAIIVPNMINNIFLTVFGGVFIPTFIKYKLKNRDEANRIASTVMNYLFIFFVFISLFLFGFASWIIKYGFDGLSPESVNLAVKILRIAAFTVILSGLIGVFSSILNAFKHFAWPAFSQMFVTIFTILFLLFFVKKMDVFVLVYGLFAGLLIRVFLLMLVARRKGYHHYFDFNLSHPAVGEMFPRALLFFIVCVGGQMNIVVDMVMASHLAPGSIAALGYATKLVQAPLIIFAGSMAVAIFPFFSTQVVKKKFEEMKDSLAKSIRMSGFIFIPLTVITVILAKPAIRLLFQRGAFTPEATNLTSIILICYSFQFFFSAVVIVLIRAFLALQDMVVLLKVAITGMIVNVILNFVFIKIITPPAAGIALSTSVVLFFQMSFMLFFLKKKMDYLHGKYILEGISKIAVVSIILGVSIFFTFKGLNLVFDSATGINQIIRITVAVFVGGVVFIGMIVLLKVEEVFKIFVKNKEIRNTASVVK